MKLLKFKNFAVGLLTAIAGPALALAYFYERNVLQLSSATPLLTVFAATSAIAIVVVALASFFDHSRLVGTIAGVAGFVFWSMSWLDAPVEVSIVIWLLVTFVASLLFWWIAKDFAWHLLLAGLLSAAVGFLSWTAYNESLPETDFSITAAGDTLSFTDAQPRNVYFFVTDGFGRLDVLEKILPNWDSQTARDTFAKHSFVIDDDATANYAETTLSVPSMLNSSLNISESQDNVVAERAKGLQALNGNNAMVKWFKSKDYEYWHAASGLFDASKCNPDIADVCFSTGGGNNEAYSALWDLSPLQQLLGTGSEVSTTERLQATDLGDWLADSVDPNQPRIVFAHLIDPHAPYSRECATQQNVTAEDFGSLEDGWQPHHKELYGAQVNCLIEDFDTTLTKIIAADPEAIIVIQADHGPAFDISWMKLSGWTTDDVWQRFAVFKATRMPDSCYSEDTNASALVNTVPMITACLAGTPPQLTDSSSYLTRYSQRTVEIIKNTVDGVLPPLENP